MISQIKIWLIALIALGATIFTAFMRGKSQGKEQQKVKQYEHQLEAIKTTQKKINEASNIDSNDVDDSLRNGDF